MTFWQEIITLTRPIRRGGVWNLPHKFHFYLIVSYGIAKCIREITRAVILWLMNWSMIKWILCTIHVRNHPTGHPNALPKRVRIFTHCGLTLWTLINDVTQKLTFVYPCPLYVTLCHEQCYPLLKFTDLYH